MNMLPESSDNLSYPARRLKQFIALPIGMVDFSVDRYAHIDGLVLVDVEFEHADGSKVMLHLNTVKFTKPEGLCAWFVCPQCSAAAQVLYFADSTLTNPRCEQCVNKGS